MGFDLKALGAKATNLFQKTREQVSQQVDQAANTVARKCTDMTGRQTTPEEVKKAAAVAGVVVLGAVVLGALSEGASPAGSGSMSSAEGRGGDFESQVGMFFAENGGSLNIETPYVDCEGQIYS